jgi:hypothetical protein
MDKKISEFAVATTVITTDIIPIVNSGNNKSVTVGVLSLNLPNLGNKGITKNVVVQNTALAIAITSSLANIPMNVLPYTLANGADGQEITIVSGTANTVTTGTNTFLFDVNASVSLVYITALTRWFVKNSYNVSIS